MLCCLQFFYNDPPWQLLLALPAGTSLVVMRRFSVSRYWPVVREHEVTVLFGIASTASLLLKAPASDDDREHQVRLAIQVGIPAPLHQELVDRWGVPWVEAYGLTETGVIVATPVERADEMIGSGSIGAALPRRGRPDRRPGRHRGRRRRARRDRRAGPRPDARLPEPAGGDGGDLPRRLAAHRRSGTPRRARATCTSSAG